MTVKRLIEKLNREDLLDLDIAVCDENSDVGNDFNITYNRYTVFLESVEWGNDLNPEIVKLDE